MAAPRVPMIYPHRQIFLVMAGMLVCAATCGLFWSTHRTSIPKTTILGENGTPLAGLFQGLPQNPLNDLKRRKISTIDINPCDPPRLIGFVRKVLNWIETTAHAQGYHTDCSTDGYWKRTSAEAGCTAGCTGLGFFTIANSGSDPTRGRQYTGGSYCKGEWLVPGRMPVRGR